MFNKMKKAFLSLFAITSLAAVNTSAYAVISSADVTTALGGVTADATTIFTVVLPIVGAVLGLTVGMKLLKRLAGAI
jgi:hypothetical protein